MHRSAVVILLIFSPALSFAEDTVLNLYRPFSETTKHVPVLIEANQKGYCEQQSQRIKREDAWHCVADDSQTYDPCFSKLFGSNTSVVCPVSPWLGNAVQITLEKPLDNRHQESLDMSRTLPWAVELQNGERCLSVESNQHYDGLQVHYQCAADVALLGDAHRCSPEWTILKHDASGISMASLSAAWF